MLESNALILSTDEIFAVILNIDTILTQAMKASTLNTFDNIDTKLLELLRTFAINNSIIMILESMEEALLRRNKVIIKSCSRIIFYVIMIFCESEGINRSWIDLCKPIRIPNILALYEDSLKWMPIDEEYIDNEDVKNAIYTLKMLII